MLNTDQTQTLHHVVWNTLLLITDILFFGTDYDEGLSACNPSTY